MTVLAAAMFLLLASIAALHAAWAFGHHWPARDERQLVSQVVGQAGRASMPGRTQSLVAAVAIFTAGVIALLLLAPRASAILALGALAAAIFAGRGIAGYLPAWRRMFSQEPFAMLDRLIYSPLCLCLAIGFAALIADRLGS